MCRGLPKQIADTGIDGTRTIGAFFLLRWISLVAKSRETKTYSFPEFTAERKE